MPTKLKSDDGPVEVPTYKEFLELKARVDAFDGLAHGPVGGHIQLTPQGDGGFVGSVNLGWQPSKVTTPPGIPAFIRADGSDIKSPIYAALDWVAYR